MVSKSEMDSIYRCLGRPGRFHILVYILLCLNYIPIVMNHIAMAVYGAKAIHRCVSNSGEGDKQTYLTSVVPNGFWNHSDTISTNGEKCGMKYFIFSNGSWSNETKNDCVKWEYSLYSNREKTIVTEWNLVCENAYRAGLSTTIYFAGVMIGGLIFGTLSDYFGRKPFVFITLFAYIIIGVGLSFVQQYLVFVILRFLIGILMQGLHTSTFVLIMELFPPEHRTWAGTATEIFWGGGVIWFSGLAFLLQDWRHIQLAMVAPSAIAIFYFWFVPESPRWLISKKKYKEVNAVISKIAKFNRVELSSDCLLDSSAVLNGSAHQPTSVIEHQPKAEKKYTILNMFLTPKLRKRSFILFYIWMVIAVGYYGLTLGVSSLAGNKYLNLFISGLVELVAYILAIFILEKFGRKRPLCAYLLISGIGCILAGIIPQKTGDGKDLSKVKSGLALFAKFGMAGAFSVILLFSSELYPTVIRNVSVGACAFWARLGGVLAPQILVLGSLTFTWLPFVIFGVVSLLGAILALLLPETLYQKLPETIEEAEGQGNTRPEVPEELQEQEMQNIV